VENVLFKGFKMGYLPHDSIDSTQPSVMELAKKVLKNAEASVEEARKTLKNARKHLSRARRSVAKLSLLKK
jgi:hypothetical protein